LKARLRRAGRGATKPRALPPGNIHAFPFKLMVAFFVADTLTMFRSLR
jgi:hypothetical protein